MPDPPARPADDGRPSRRRMMIAAIAAVAVLIAAGILALLLLKGGGAPAGSASLPAAHPGTSLSGTTTASAPTPSPSSVAGPPGAEDRTFFQESLQSGNTAALESRFASPVQVVIAASDCCGMLTGAQAVQQLSTVQPGTSASWSFALDAATLAAYRDGFYGQYFPGDALVGQSSDGFVASFLPGADGTIGTMFLATTAEL